MGTHSFIHVALTRDGLNPFIYTLVSYPNSCIYNDYMTVTYAPAYCYYLLIFLGGSNCFVDFQQSQSPLRRERHLLFWLTLAQRTASPSKSSRRNFPKLIAAMRQPPLRVATLITTFPPVG